MPTKSKRPYLVMEEDTLKELRSISKSRTEEKRKIERANILLCWHERMPIGHIATKLNLSKSTVYRCIDKALSFGTLNGLKDLYHCPKPSKMTYAGKAWVVNVACSKPKNFGLSAELWSMHSLAHFIRCNADKHGHTCLMSAGKATVHRILKEHDIKPHKIKYYLEKRDPEFDKKMKEILIVYKEVELENKKDDHDKGGMVTVCVDEKPGVQAIENTAPDLTPVAHVYSSHARDHEYIRHGTASILAGLDLHDGHVFAQVHKRHRSVEFIALLKEIDAYYPESKRIRLVLDNHSAHISKETMAFLATKPNRFVYVLTPTHGSWLNLAETLFGKMARTFLKAIRVDSWEELKERILKGVAEINQCPVVHKWSKFDALNRDAEMTAFL